ncbi:MAG: hypothetical protein JST59_25995 [Actinobacteria bacterium]|nr:hypothetical protein [Actinomycetota bacterium]
MGAEPPETDPPQGFDVDDRELDQFIADWEAVDRQAARVLREALGEHRGELIPDGEPDAVGSRMREGLATGVDPFDWIGRAAGLDREAPPDDDTELLLRCVAATISPREETGLDPEEEAMMSSIEHADWLGAIVSLVRAGPGADASPRSLVAGIAACPEVEPGPGGDSDDDVAFLEAAFSVLAVPWLVLGVIDREERLTALGAWMLPRSLARAWGSDFDAVD